MMTTATIIPTTTRCCLRVVDDIQNEVRIVEIDRSRGEVIDQLIFLARDIRLAQKSIRLCVHFTKETITAHFWSDDLDFARALVGVGSIPHRALKMLQTGEEDWT